MATSSCILYLNVLVSVLPRRAGLNSGGRPSWTAEGTARWAQGGHPHAGSWILYWPWGWLGMRWARGCKYEERRTESLSSSWTTIILPSLSEADVVGWRTGPRLPGCLIQTPSCPPGVPGSVRVHPWSLLATLLSRGLSASWGLGGHLVTERKGSLQSHTHSVLSPQAKQ